MPSYRSGGAIAYEPDSWPSDPQDAVQGTQYQRTMSFRAGAAIELYELVMLDTSDTTGFEGYTVIPSAAGAVGANADLVMGVAQRAASDGDTVEVVVGGYTLVQAADGITAGQVLTTFNTNDGEVEDGTVGTHTIIGVAVTATGTPLAGHVFMKLHPRI